MTVPPASPLRARLSASWRWIALALVLGVILFRPVVQALQPEPPGTKIRLWHAYRGGEEEVLHDLVRRFNEREAGRVWVDPQPVPDEARKDKLVRNIPWGSGPDLFISPHNELGEYLIEGIVAPVPPGALPFATSEYLPKLLDGVSSDDTLYAFPLTYKGLFLFWNTRLCPDGPPTDISQLPALRDRLREQFVTDDQAPPVFPIAYPASDFFFHAPLFIGAGGELFTPDDRGFRLFDEPGRATFSWPGQWKADGILPVKPDYNEMVRQFEEGTAACIICGAWYTPGGAIAEANEWSVAPLPAVNGRPTGSLVSVEALFVSPESDHPELAHEVAAFFAGPEAARERLQRLQLPPVEAAAYQREQLPPTVPVQQAALEHGLVTPNHRLMSAVWTPARLALEASVAGRDVDDAIRDGNKQLALAIQQPAEPVDFTPWGIGLAILLVAMTTWLVIRIRTAPQPADYASARLTGFTGRHALPYLVPGMVAVLLLVMIPLVIGAIIAFFAYDRGHFTFVGVDNFTRILAPDWQDAFRARSFWFALVVTIAWTTINLILHVAIGVTIALLLRPAWNRLSTVYRLILILPWAIPNYITALMWKGMFHTQIGAVNVILQSLGAEPVDWFSHFFTSFCANVVTNTWLGFPFMMVVTLGALQTVPKDLEDAATLDGASRWQRFWLVTMPHLRPALVPAIILGSVWTFNMFNVIYLVSGGQPGGQTDILISEAYRWAFERGHRFGYAAAYSVLIFFVLLLYSRMTSRLTKA